MAEDPADGNGPCVRMAAALSCAARKLCRFTLHDGLCCGYFHRM